MSKMLRVSQRTQERVMKAAKDDFGGATVDEVIGRLLDEHWKARLIRAVDDYSENNPEGWKDYLSEAAEWDATAPAADEWNEKTA